MTQDTCADCGKPLGSTVMKCHDCGGISNRGGDPIDPHEWQILLGVGAENLKEINFQSRNIDSEEHHAHHAAGGSDES